MSQRRFRFWIPQLVLASIFLLCQPALDVTWASNASEKDQATRQNWREMMHYALMGNWDVARGYGEKLLEEDPDPVLLLDLAEDDRYADHYRNLALLKVNSPLKEIAESILKLVEEGRFRRRTDRQRIAAEVKRLSGTTRARMMALRRLQDSGEWAVPVIISVLRDPSRSDELFVIRWALRQLGKPAVNPLVVALQGCTDLHIRLIVLDALGKIGYPSALAYIKQLMETKPASAELRAAALKAFVAIDSQGEASNMSAASLFEQLGEDYYTHVQSLAVPANQEYANIWFWDDQKGLLYERVKRGAFDELMAMRCCEWTLRLDANRAGAISLWLSAFFRLEAEGHEQPGYFGENHADAGTYALTSGPEYLHRALERALKDRNRPVALGVIQALQRNSGQQSLLYQLESQQPLIAALNYPDREVRFSAALTIGGALPRQAFEHSKQVAPILAEALRQKGQRYALVVDADSARRNRLVAELRPAGRFAEVIGDEHFAVALERARRFPSFDLVVLSADIERPSAPEALEIMKNDYRLAFCPTIIITSVQTLSRARKLQKDNSFVEVVVDQTAAAEFPEIAEQIFARNQASKFAADRADYYAGQAAEILRQLSLAGNTVVELKAAEGALIEALSDQRQAIQKAATETLARIDSVQAQRAIARLALDSEVNLEKRLMAFRNLSVSAKAYGNLLLAEQVDTIYGLVSSLEVGDKLRNLAAEAYGSLNLPSAKISQLIIDQSMVTAR